MAYLHSVIEVADILLNEQRLVQRYMWNGHSRRSAIDELATNLGLAAEHGHPISLIQPRMPNTGNEVAVPFGYLVREIDLGPEDQRRYVDPGYIVGQIIVV